MRIAHAESTPWTAPPAVRGGTIEFKTLLEGSEGRPDNYQLLLARTDISFKSPRHRHNFDQLRFGIEGTTHIGQNFNLEAGDLGYFPEGTYYGPQDQASVGMNSLVMVIQFGGPCGNGYMSRREMRESFDRMQADGRFEGGVYRRNTAGPDGRMNQDAYEAVWEHHNRRPITYSKPRFLHPVHLREANFDWISMDQRPGVATRHLASFTERGIVLESMQLQPDAGCMLPASDRTRIVFIERGTGEFGATGSWQPHTAVHLSAGESIACRATALTEALILQLPHL